MANYLAEKPQPTSFRCQLVNPREEEEEEKEESTKEQARQEEKKGDDQEDEVDRQNNVDMLVAPPPSPPPPPPPATTTTTEMLPPPVDFLIDGVDVKEMLQIRSLCKQILGNVGLDITILEEEGEEEELDLLPLLPPPRAESDLYQQH